MLTSAQKKCLSGLFLFAGADDPALQTACVDTRLKIENYTAGQMVYSTTCFTAAICVVLKGSVTVTTPQNGGKCVPLRTIGRGEMFGAASLFGAEEYPTEVRAKAETTVCVLPQALVEGLIHAYPAVALRYIGFLSDRIRFLNRKIHGFTAGSVEAKLATYLLSEESAQISLTKLATALDVGRASLYRALQALTQRKIIEKEGKQIRICDLPALRSVAEAK